MRGFHLSLQLVSLLPCFHEVFYASLYLCVFSNYFSVWLKLVPLFKKNTTTTTTFVVTAFLVVFHAVMLHAIATKC